MNESHNIEELDKKYAEDAPSAEFAALLDQSEEGKTEPEKERALSVGQRLSGKLRDIGTEFAFVDYGGRSEAAIDVQELRNEDGDLAYNSGDTVEAYVASVEGEVRLTLSLRASSVEVLRQAYENEVPVEGRVTGFNTGGLVVNLAGRRAFCPISQIDTGYSEDLASYAGQTLPFRILEFRDRGRNIVLSHRAHLEAENRRQAQALREKLSEGAELVGKVTRLERFGAFVDLGGVEGLVHVSEINHSRVEHPKDLLAVGNEVRVKILELKNLGGDKERISLSIKALLPDPWDEAPDRFREGDLVRGKVVSIQQFGAFVELLPGVEGLVHISQLASDRRVSRPGEVVSVGQEVQVRVQNVDRAQKRISLSMKAAQKEAADSAEKQEIQAFQTRQDQTRTESAESTMADALRRAGLL